MASAAITSLGFCHSSRGGLVHVSVGELGTAGQEEEHEKEA